jgi:hypothetical protein
VRPALRAGLVVVFFAALTGLLAAPLSLHPAERALPLSADTRLFLWTLSWDVHALASDPLHLFDANIFFPERRTLAYSEHLLGSALLGAPFLAATGNPVLALNVALLLSCVLSGAGSYWLARRLGIGPAGALLAGVVFAFAPPRFTRLAQLHLATVQWIPFSLAALHAYAETRARRYLLLATALFTLQALTSGHGGLFLLLAGVGLLAWLAALGRLPGPVRLLRDLGVPGVLLLAVNVPFVLPYFQVQREVGLRRTLGAVEDFAPDAASFLAAPTHAQQALLSLAPSLRTRVEGARAYLFPGWLTLTLAALALRRKRPAEALGPPVPGSRPTGLPTGSTGRVWLLDTAVALAAVATLALHVWGGFEWTVGGHRLSATGPGRAAWVLAGLVLLRLAVARRAPFAFTGALRAGFGWTRRQLECRTGTDLGFYVLLAFSSLWAALGPRFGLYTVLYRLLPGFDLIRVPSRLTILTLLALAVLAGAGLERLLARLPSPSRLAVGGLALALLAAELAEAPLKAVPYPVEIPAVDRWLATQPGRFAVVELPVADPGDPVASARLHSHAMLHSMAHWQPLVNGYSGLTPPRHERLFRILTAFPDTASLGELEALGVRFVVLHPGSYPSGGWARVEPRLAAFGDRLRLEVAAEGGRVYSLSRTWSR